MPDSIHAATSRRSALALLAASTLGTPARASSSGVVAAGTSAPAAFAITARLRIAFEETGPRDAPVLVLLHGWPYDPRSFDPVVPLFVQAGYRVVVPFCRGCGATRFVSDAIPRSGEQAALGMDVVALLDALGIARAVLAGYDWGARAACVAAALRPERVRALVSCSGYNIHAAPDRAAAIDAGTIHRLWYVWFLNTPMADTALTPARDGLARLLWQLWSPRTPFDEARFLRTAPSFDNPDWVAVTLSCYRTFFGTAPRDPFYAEIESFLRTQPPVRVPTLVLPGGSDGLYDAADTAADADKFPIRCEREVLARAGHCPPTDDPAAFAAAILRFLGGVAP